MNFKNPILCFALETGVGKTWLFHDAIAENMSIQGLAAQFSA
jgi:hypothetical protein